MLKLRWAVPLESEYASYIRTKHPELADLYRQLKTAPETVTHPPDRSAPPSPTDETAPGGGIEARLRSLSLSAAPTAQAAHGGSNADASKGPLARLEMAHAAHSPVDADWMHYLSQVHRTPSMRARRWVWALAEELARVYRRKKAEGPYADPEPSAEGGQRRDGREEKEEEERKGGEKWPGKSEAWRAYAQSVEQQYEMWRVVQGAGIASGRETRFTW